MTEATPHFSDSQVLVIDDIASMRAQIVSNLNSLGFRNVASVNSCQRALTQLEHIKVDLILCDYHLGEVTSGQQLLEHLRSKSLIPATTLFVMVTARRAYEEVIRAAEFSPDDYLVKPFTGAQLSTRLTQLFERRERFRGVHKALAKADWQSAIALCDSILRAGDRFAMEANKLKGQALLKAARPAEAELLYRSIISIRSLGWAELGLARALVAQNALAAAEIVLDSLLASGTKFSASDRMGAYDELVQVMEATERNKDALGVMQTAMNLSSGSMARARKLTTLAVSEGELALAAKTVRQLVSDNKNSHVKIASDYLMAADVLTQSGFADDALSTISAVRKSFDTIADLQTLAVAEAGAHVAKGNNAAATELLQHISIDHAVALPAATAAALGKTLYRMGDDESANKVMRHLIQNDPDNKDVARTVHAAMAAVGKQELAKALIDSSIQEVAAINNEGVRLAYANQLDEAVELLTKAAELLPGNTQFVSNAALVIALALTKAEQVDRNQYQSCLKYRGIVAAREPAHPKLPQIDGLLKILQGVQYDAASRSA
jgi:DNA-binding response OmpR family regulator/Flp pilus assembly protein TadD